MRQQRLLFGKKKVWCVNRGSLQVPVPAGRNVPQLIGETNIVATGMPESDIKTICKKCVTHIKILFYLRRSILLLITCSLNIVLLIFYDNHN